LFDSISQQYCRSDGFVNRPDSYTGASQRQVLYDMDNLGRTIWDIFQGLSHPVRAWLDELLKSNDERAQQPVTILTNDFSIPWFWLKRTIADPFLCEVCALGLLQFAPVNQAVAKAGASRSRRGAAYDAMLINGLPHHPFVKGELDKVKEFLEKPTRNAMSFKTHYVDSNSELHRLRSECGDKRLINDFKIVHFCGQYSKDMLCVNGGALEESFLNFVLCDALLVLDGYSSGDGASAWPLVASVTSALVNNGGALGCVVPVLPVKEDPVVAKVLWGSLYQELRWGAITIGQALVKTRFVLKSQFENNPAWAAYQLIGAPAGLLCADTDDKSSA
jgi:hypothetical protein